MYHLTPLLWLMATTISYCQSVDTTYVYGELVKDSIYYIINNDEFDINFNSRIYTIISDCQEDTRLIIDYDNYGIADRILIYDIDSMVIADTKWVGGSDSQYIPPNVGFRYDSANVSIRLNEIPFDFSNLSNGYAGISGKGRVVVSMNGLDTVYLHLWSYPNRISATSFKVNTTKDECPNLTIVRDTDYVCYIVQDDNVYDYERCGCDTMTITHYESVFSLDMDTVLTGCDVGVYILPDVYEWYTTNGKYYYPGDTISLLSENTIIDGHIYNCSNEYMVTYNILPSDGIHVDTSVLVGTILDLPIPNHIRNGEYSYAGHYINEFGCICDINVEIHYIEKKYYVPNSISPNGDGINDCLEVYGDVVSGYELTIYDRWGGVISSDIGMWCPSADISTGAYMVTALITLTNGETIVYGDIIYLIK